MATVKPIFVLIDCNNFFVSCERVFRPDLWDKPVAVLSNNDACIVARSNEVKALGVQMAEPYFKVRDVLRKAGATLFSANFTLYGDMSQRVIQILQAECPEIEVYSVDESFLQISRLPIKDYAAWGRELSAKVFKWTGLPVSVGIAPTKTLAKAAADFCKKHPEQQGAFSIIGDESKREQLLKWLDLRSIWGVGYRTTPKLRGYGLANAYDLSKVSDKWALEQLTIRGLKTVRELRGESCIPLETVAEPQKTIARTRSFGHNVRSYYELEGAIATFAAQAATRLRKQGELAGAVFTYLSASKNDQAYYGGSQLVRLHPATAQTGELIGAALKGLQQAYDPDFAYKSAGVILMDLTTVQQLAFTSDPAKLDRQAVLMNTVDRLNRLYGTRLIRHASEHIESNNWHSKRQQRSPSYTTSWRELRLVKT